MADGGLQDEHLDVVYNNETLNRDDWHTFEVGKTRFNDEALRQAGQLGPFFSLAKPAVWTDW